MSRRLTLIMRDDVSARRPVRVSVGMAMLCSSLIILKYLARSTTSPCTMKILQTFNAKPMHPTIMTENGSSTSGRFTNRSMACKTIDTCLSLTTAHSLLALLYTTILNAAPSRRTAAFRSRRDAHSRSQNHCPDLRFRQDGRDRCEIRGR